MVQIEKIKNSSNQFTLKIVAFIYAGFFLLVSINPLYAQCPTTSINFTLQDEVDQFILDYPNCSDIQVTITLEGDDITNLVGFSNLKSIFGQLRILNLSNLVDLNGLDNLENISGHLNIDNNAALTTLNGLENLSYIGGWLGITDNNELQSINSLQNLTGRIAGGLNIWNNGSLTSLQGLEGISKIPGFFNILGNAQLINLSGLENIDSLEGFLHISNNVLLADISALENLDPTTIRSTLMSSNDLTIAHNPQLANCAIESICGFFNMSDPTITTSITNNGMGCGDDMEIISACTPVSAFDPLIDNEPFKLFPNPFSQTLQFISEIESPILFSIYDMAGRLILHESTNQRITTLSLDSLNPGVYLFCSTDAQGRIYRQKLIKS